jgi:hypothetical protein
MASLIAGCDPKGAELEAKDVPPDAASVAVPAGTPAEVDLRAMVSPTVTSIPSEPKIDERPIDRSDGAAQVATLTAATSLAVPSPSTTRDTTLELAYELVEYLVPGGSRPHDVAPAPMVGSGTRPRDRASSAFWTRSPVRPGTYRSAPGPPHTASSSDPTVRPGSPIAA